MAKAPLFDKPVKELDASKVSNAQLQDMKIERAKDIAEVVVKLCNQLNRKDGVAVVNHIIEDLDQLYLVGLEAGRRLERDTVARKLPR